MLQTGSLCLQHSSLSSGLAGSFSLSGDLGSIPGLGRSPGEGHGKPLQYSCLGKPHGRRSLAGCSPRGCREPGMTERLSTQHSSWLVWISTQTSPPLERPPTLYASGSRLHLLSPMTCSVSLPCQAPRDVSLTGCPLPEGRVLTQGSWCCQI